LPPDPDRGVFLKDSSTLQHILAHIFAKTERIFMKILSYLYPWTRKSLLNFGSNPDADFRCRPDFLWWRYTISKCSCYLLCV